MMFINTPKISANLFVFLVSTYLVGIFNFPFYSKAFKAIVSLDSFNVLFLLSVPLLLLSLFILIISTFSWRFLLKPLSITLVMLSVFIFYGTQNYGVIFDYGMIQNTVETDYSEAISYINLQSTLTILLLGILPSLVISMTSINWNPPHKELFQRSKIILASLITTFIIAGCFYSNYAAVGRNNSELIKYIVPFKFIDASYKYARNNYFSAPLPFKILDDSPQVYHPNNLANKSTNTSYQNATKQVFVLVVGETASAGHFSYNGYNKPTNQYSAKFDVQSFKNISSCGTATAVSVPCMFSLLEQNNFDKRTASSQQNVLDLAQLAGIDVLWVDNDSGCKGVCNRVPTIEESTDKSDPLCDGDYCFDEVLLRELKNKLNNITSKSTLIVLHMIGSHGPTYYRRYPKSHRVFMPDCSRSDIQNCSQEELVNTYDNTIAYTDFVLANIMSELTDHSEKNNTNTSMLYISDHGESLGEKGIYLHGLPYALAPEEQTHVPLLFWTNKKLINNEKHCQNTLISKQFSHDNISHTILGKLNIDTTLYQAEKDIFSACRPKQVYANITKAAF